MTKFKSETEHHKAIANSADEAAGLIDRLKILQAVWSKHLSPERYNGIIDLLYVTFYPNATTNEIENALVKYIKIQNFINKDIDRRA